MTAWWHPHPVIKSRWDMIFRDVLGKERLIFGCPGAICQTCHQVFVESELIDDLDLKLSECIFAIENDNIYQEKVGL